MDKKLLETIPLDKAWMIRMGILDLINGHKDILEVLNKEEDLGEDLQALKRISKVWDSDEPFDVGESGTIYKYLRFYLWKNKIEREIVKRGTLVNRKIADDPEIVNLPIADLLKLDGGTSQWASASVLYGNTEKFEGDLFYLNKTYDAVKHWKEKRDIGKVWEAKKDPTLNSQVKMFLELLETGKTEIPNESITDCDLYCFFRTFNLMTKEEGEKRWPHIANHETNRFEEMEDQLEKYRSENFIDSKDHRVVHALVMKSLVEGEKIEVKFPDAVNKTWPRFWEFVNIINHNNPFFIF